MTLKPFWRYYGGKYRTAPHYPPPRHETIIEPFAGMAGYSLRYPNRHVILVEKYPRIAEIWKYLIRVPAREIMRIPLNPEHIDEIPNWVPEPARDLIGFWFNNATVSPCKSLSSGRRKLAGMGRKLEGWTVHTRYRVASQLRYIRHWRIIEGDYTLAPDIDATWFIDPPYANRAGRYYVHSDIDYAALATWCRSRKGQAIVCENLGADWLPFQHLVDSKSMQGTSKEAIWTNILERKRK